VESVFVILGVLVVLWLTAWLARRGRRPSAQEPYAFTRAEIASYNTALPKYLLAAAICLLMGGIHGFIVQLPAVRLWLSQAGEPAHLLVGEVREQLITVGGVVMLTMGLTCYALPALIGRPLRNHNLARLSFVLTFAGVLLTTLVTATAGLLQGLYVQRGGSYADAYVRLGSWERFPLFIFQGARDAGYWTFALLIVLTVLSSRNVIWPRHRRRLTAWLLVSAAAFFLVVWQRILQGLPGNALLLRNGSRAAILTGYQAYIHLHLYAGALVPVATATFVYLLERKAEQRTDWRRANRILAGLALAASAFYLARLGLGLYEAYRPAGQASNLLDAWGPPLLSLTGLGLLVALGAYCAYATQLTRQARSYLPAVTIGTLRVSLGLALLAGIHGATLALRPSASPGPVSEAHGTLAVGATLLLPALTLADMLLIDTARTRPTVSLFHAGLGFLGAGIVLSYLATLGLGGPAASLAAAGLQLAGFLTFALHTFQATAAYRLALRARLHFLRPAGARPSALALLELPRSQVLLIELLAALFGFPGFGWLFAGYTLAAVLLLYIGPGVAWALIPSLFTLSQGWLYRLNWNLLLLYLPASAFASTLALRAALYQAGAGAGRHAPPLAREVETTQEPAAQEAEQPE
jgi:hypothetical protein